MAVSHQKYDIFNGERFPHACCVTLMFMCRRRRRSREDKPLPRRHFLLQLGKAGSRRRRWRRRALVVVDQRAAMGSWARTRCDLAMMEAESVKGCWTAKQQMEVWAQQQPSNSLKGPPDVSAVRTARAKAAYYRRWPSHTCGRWTPFSKWPTAHIQLKLQSYTSSCLRMVGYAATARNPVPPISLCVL